MQQLLGSAEESWEEERCFVWLACVTVQAWVLRETAWDNMDSSVVVVEAWVVVVVDFVDLFVDFVVVVAVDFVVDFVEFEAEFVVEKEVLVVVGLV